MIAHVVPERGTRTRGLIEYLWGRGEENEHENARVVAAWDQTFVREVDEAELDHFERGLLAREMEAPLRLHNIEPGKHVYHVPVSVRRDDGELTDEQWAQVAEEAAEKLGFTATEDRTAVPWVAMRHGLSKEGNDHIHFFAVLYRESGERVFPRDDFAVWEDVRHAAERRWDLTKTRSRGGGLPELTRAEVQRAGREGRVEPDRRSLARTVRSAATAARDEADFVNRVRRSGVLIRPRWDRGESSDHAVGYSVAVKPSAPGSKPIWYGGGKLADDLTLTEVRRRWAEPSEERAADTRRAWRPRGWRGLPTGRQGGGTRMRAEAWQQAADKTAEVRRALAQVHPSDTATWAGVAHEASGALAALAGRTDIDKRGDLRRAADALARSAQTDSGTRAHRRPPVAHALGGVVRTASDAVLAARGGPYGVAALVIQLGRLVQAIQQANEQAGRAVQAQREAQAAREMLAYVRSTPRTEAPVERSERPQQPTRMLGERDHRAIPRQPRESHHDRER